MIGDTYGKQDPRASYHVGRNEYESKEWWDKQREAADHASKQLADAESGRSSVAQQQLRAGLSDAQRQQAGMAAGRGSNPLAQRAAMYSGGQMASQMGGQAAALRAQEMQAAHAMRQQQLQMHAAGVQQYDALAQQAAIASARNDLAMSELRQADEHQAQQNAVQWGSAIAGAVGGGGGAAMMASDYRVKAPPSGTALRVAELSRQLDAEGDQTRSGLGLGAEDPRVSRLSALLDAEGERTGARLAAPSPRTPADDEAARVSDELDREADETMRRLQASRWQYRPEAQAEGAPPGDRAGIMAQDLEQTPLGRSAVVEDERGMKQIDIPQTASITAGLVGRAGRRLDDLEARLARIEGRR